MLSKVKKVFQDDRKYFAIVFFIVFLIIASGIFTPIYINYKQSNWSTELSERIIEIEGSVKNLHKQKENSLLQKGGSIKSELKRVLSPNHTSYGKLIELVNHPEYKDISVEVIAPNGKIIAWNNKPAIPQNDIFPLNFPAGETFFYNSGLLTYLSLLDTINIETDHFYFIVSLPYEKKYNIQNEYYREVSFINEISTDHFTQFEIDFTPYASKSKDGRKYSFELRNNKKNKIGLVTFFKPAITVMQNTIYSEVSFLQSMLALLAFIFAGLGFRKEYRELKNNFLRLLLFILYCAAFRTLLFVIDFPSRLVEGPLTDPANFSSAFGWGIVKSPLDFLLTVLFFLLISIRAFAFLTDYIARTKEKKNKSIILFAVIVPLTALAFFITLRGLSASLRSVIFDSSLRYFKGTGIIPELPVLFVIITVLMLALGIVLFLAIYLIAAFKMIPVDEKKHIRTYSFIILIIYLAVGVIYIITQENPLITVLTALLFTVMTWVFIYQVYTANLKSVFNFVYASLIGSALSITLLNSYNIDLEQESLKTTAAEINRPDESLIKFLITEALLSSAQKNDIKSIFIRSNVNYDAAAFVIWSASALQRESLNSAIILLDAERIEKGRFTVGIDDEPVLEELFAKMDESNPGILKLPGKESGKDYYAGLIPIVDRGYISGFIAALVEYHFESLAITRIPDFLQSGKRSDTRVVEPGKLNIFQFRDGKLVSVVGDLYPSIEQIKPIINAKTNESGEAWITMSFNNEDYKTYIQSSGDDITAVSLKENHFSWRLFNFFKIFIVHSVIILLLYCILYFAVIRKIRYSFRTQLLIAFLVISVFPVLLLAFYNRQVVTGRSAEEVLSELNERASYLQNHVDFQLRKHPERDLNQTFKNAGEELGISFSIYENTNLVFSSAAPYYTAGLFPDKINPEAYYNLNYLSFREYVIKEKLDEFIYNSFYKKIAVKDQNYILCVNDAFNKVEAALAPAEFDIFLFGVYSFAVLIIIIISTILANKISSPIRKLTYATESVAHGDLNIRVSNPERGEIKDLIEGFNYMTEELRKNEVEMAMLERENAWKEMAKQVAHEIKNPLTPMKLAVQQLVISFRDRNKNFEDIFEKVSSTLLSQIENLNQIASEFSRFARMPKFDVEEIDILEALRDTANLFLEEHIKIKVNTSLEKANAASDKAQTRRMFINLIRNSIQAEASKINIELSANEQHFRILFSDDGKGIPAGTSERIFEPGFTTKDKGMGIGLKISRRYLESIGGEINLLETSSKGTVFEIKIPGKI